MRIISEGEFSEKIKEALKGVGAGCVTGPGRSGAITSVYASHILKVPFIPYGCKIPDLGRLLIIDTATESGRTLKKAARRYGCCGPIVIAVYHEPPRVMFWYESTKPQKYKHEDRDDLSNQTRANRPKF